MKSRTFILTALLSSMSLSGTLAFASLSMKQEEDISVPTRSVRATLFGQEEGRRENKGPIALEQRKIKMILDKAAEKSDALAKKRKIKMILRKALEKSDALAKRKKQ